MRSRHLVAPFVSLVAVACSSAPIDGTGVSTAPVMGPPTPAPAEQMVLAATANDLPPALDPAATFADAESVLETTGDTGPKRVVTILTTKHGPTSFTHRVSVGDERTLVTEVNVTHVSPTHLALKNANGTTTDQRFDAPVTPADFTGALMLAAVMEAGGSAAARSRRTLGGADCYGQDMTCSIPEWLRKSINVIFTPTLSKMLDNHRWSFPCPTLFDWSRRGIADIEECCQEHDRRLYCGTDALLSINGDFGLCVGKKVLAACKGGLVNTVLAPVLATTFFLAVQAMTMGGAGDYDQGVARKEQRKASCLCGGTQPTAHCWSDPCKATTCSTERARRYPQMSDFTAGCSLPPPHEEGGGMPDGGVGPIAPAPAAW